MDSVRAGWRRFRQLPVRWQVVVWIGIGLVLVAAIALGSGGQTKNSVNTSSGRVATSSTPSQPATGPSPATPGAPTTTQAATTAQPPEAPTTVGSVPAPTAGSCHATGTGLYILPDPSCTPGGTNPAVTQGDIDTTICTSGWTATVRPPESYTEPLKYQQMAAYGDTGPASGYEEDHLIPLELGGSPTSPQNLWPEPGPSPNPKDDVENAANRAVCDRSITLVAAQQAIAANWIGLGQALGVTQSAPSVSPTTAPPSTAQIMPATTTPVTASYRAGEYCAKAMIGQTVQTSEGPLSCEVTNDPSHPRWEHS